MAGLIIALVLAVAIAGWEGYLLWRNIKLVINVEIKDDSVKLSNLDLVSKQDEEGGAVVIIKPGQKYDKIPGNSGK